jgi:hypothetical protein
MDLAAGNQEQEHEMLVKNSRQSRRLEPLGLGMSKQELVEMISPAAAREQSLWYRQLMRLSVAELEHRVDELTMSSEQRQQRAHTQHERYLASLAERGVLTQGEHDRLHGTR